MNDVLNQLLDKDACRDVLAKYGPACDWLDQKALEEIFWPDADIDYGFFKGKAAEFIPLLIQIEQRHVPARRFHMSGCERIRVTGNEAHAESYGVTQSAIVDDSGKTIAKIYFGRYVDRLAKRDGAWRIASRHYLLNAAVSVPAMELSGGLEKLNWADDTSTSHPLYF